MTLLADGKPVDGAENIDLTVFPTDPNILAFNVTKVYRHTAYSLLLNFIYGLHPLWLND